MMMVAILKLRTVGFSILALNGSVPAEGRKHDRPSRLMARPRRGAAGAQKSRNLGPAALRERGGVAAREAR